MCRRTVYAATVPAFLTRRFAAGHAINAVDAFPFNAAAPARCRVNHPKHSRGRSTNLPRWWHLLHYNFALAKAGASAKASLPLRATGSSAQLRVLPSPGATSTASAALYTCARATRVRSVKLLPTECVT